MRAIVKRPYFDDLGLHKVGEVVEVEQASDLVEITEGKKEVKAEPKEEVNTEPKAKATTKKVAKKKG